MAPLALLLAACALAAPLHAASLAAPSLAPPAHAIPVPVLLDAEPSLNELDDVEIERPAPDLRNPGPPQRQEHDSQAPERHSADHLDLSAIRESIERTRDSLAQSLRDTSANVQSWLADPRDQTDILTSVHRLRDTFSTQIQKLNETIHTLIKPEVPAQVESERKVDVIESNLKGLKDNFNSGIETLSAGVELAALLKSSDLTTDEEGREESSSIPPVETSTSAWPIQGVNQFFNNLSHNMTTGFNSIMNIFSRPPTDAQSDTPVEASSNRPGAGIFNFLGNITWPALPVPNWAQNLSPGNIQQNLQNLLRPSTTTVKPAGADSNSSSEPVKADPAPGADKPEAAEKPAEAQKPAVTSETSTQAGPIRQFLSNIPVVQRIQSALGNRDTPRQPAAAAAPAGPAPAASSDVAQVSPAAGAAEAPAAVPADASSQTKGGFYGPRPGVSDNSISNNGMSKQRSEEVKETEESKKEVKEPLIEVKEPLKEVKEPLKEVKEPLKAVKEPLKEVKEPLKEVKEPLKEVKESHKEVKEPLKDVKEPLKDVKEPLKEEIKKNEEAELKPEPVADKTE